MYGFADKNAHTTTTTSRNLEHSARHNSFTTPSPQPPTNAVRTNGRLKDMVCCSIILIIGFSTGIIVGIVALAQSGLNARGDASYVQIGIPYHISNTMIAQEWQRTCALHNTTFRDDVRYVTSMCIARISHGSYFDLAVTPDGIIQPHIGGGTLVRGCSRYCWIVKNCYIIPEEPNIHRCSTIPSCKPFCNTNRNDLDTNPHRYSFRVDYRYS